MSLRSSERGLKSEELETGARQAGSLRSSERGLKSELTDSFTAGVGRSVRRSVD